MGVAAIALIMATPAGAEPSFKGKTVRMIVGSPPGGGTDLGGRMFARFIGKYLPDSPVIVVQNVPGASGIKAMNFMTQQAPADGTTFIADMAQTPDAHLKFLLDMREHYGLPVPDEKKKPSKN
jgi:tripartite-type tricarboxylate transporter receptor subunit TctC